MSTLAVPYNIQNHAAALAHGGKAKHLLFRRARGG